MTEQKESSDVDYDISTSTLPAQTTIKKIITDLKNAIDEMHLHSKTAKDLILATARCLDEKKQCKQSQICSRIKQLLKDKIDEGKITAKWIEDCLSKEYKRKYEYDVKSEVTSLSKKRNRSGATCVLVQPDREDHSQVPSTTSSVGSPTGQELQGTLHKSANSLSTTEFQIPKDMRGKILSAIDDSSEMCYVTFDQQSGRLITVESDVSRQSRISGDEGIDSEKNE